MQRFPIGGEYGSRTPVESREKREAGVTNDVVVPMLLALLISSGVAMTYLAFVLAARVVKDSTFALTAMIGSGALFFVVPLARRRADTPEEATVGTIAAGLLFVTLGAYFSTAVYNVTRNMTLQQILISALPLGLVAGLLWLILSTFQESFFRSPFVEQAIANILGGPDGPWWKDKAPVREDPRFIRLEIIDKANNRLANLDPQITEDQAEWLTDHMLSGGVLSVPACSGTHKPLSRDDVERLRQILLSEDLVAWVNSHKPSLGVILTRRGALFFEDLNAELAK